MRQRKGQNVPMIGVGALASLLGALQFASQFGLLSSTTEDTVRRVANDTRNIAGNGFSSSDYDVNYANASSAVNGLLTSFQQSTGSDSYNSHSYNPVSYVQNTTSINPNDISIYFSPNGNCTAAIAREIRNAQRQILVQAYSFTSEAILKELADARARGVAVIAILDKSQTTEAYSLLNQMIRSNITTLIDSQHAIAHNKIMLIDGLTVITGSFNFTVQAEQQNAENLLVIQNRPDVYAKYEANFKHHYEHSQLHQVFSNSARAASLPFATPRTGNYPTQPIQNLNGRTY